MTTTTTLTKTATGYATRDGRWTVTPKIIGDSPRSKGSRQFVVVNTATGTRKIVPLLADARDYIATLDNR